MVARKQIEKGRGWCSTVPLWSIPQMTRPHLLKVLPPPNSATLWNKSLIHGPCGDTPDQTTASSKQGYYRLTMETNTDSWEPRRAAACQWIEALAVFINHVGREALWKMSCRDFSLAIARVWDEEGNNETPRISNFSKATGWKSSTQKSTLFLYMYMYRSSNQKHTTSGFRSHM